MANDQQHLVNIEKVEYHYHNHIDLAQLISEINIIKLQNSKIMATVKELNDKADELQAALDAEQEQIQSALDKLQATVTDLQGQLADGGTAEERQAVLDKLNSAITDLKSTIPDEPAPQG